MTSPTQIRDAFEASLNEAQVVLEREPGDAFVLRCSCGWETNESRRYVLRRIGRHFDWRDVDSFEKVTVTVGVL